MAVSQYGLGVDLGTTYTAAAVSRSGSVELCSLGDSSPLVPSVVLLAEDGSVLVGDAAARRAVFEPQRVAREFKRRLGDPVPLLLGGSPMSPQALMSRLLRRVVEHVTEREGGPPDQVVVTYPANWGPHRLELLHQAITMAGVENGEVLPEPVAAAVDAAAGERFDDGAVLAVYDLGGGTFDAAVLRKQPDGFEVLGRPEGVEHLGGVDFDAAVFGHVVEALGDDAAAMTGADDDVVAAVARLRRECAEAKEALTQDVDTAVVVALPGVARTVRLTRAEFEEMIRPAVGDTVDCLLRTIASAGLEPPAVTSVLLVGGSARIPLVAQLLGSRLGRPVALAAHPKSGVALGAARVAGDLLGGRSPGTGAAPVVGPVVGPVPAVGRPLTAASGAPQPQPEPQPQPQPAPLPLPAPRRAPGRVAAVLGTPRQAGVRIGSVALVAVLALGAWQLFGPDGGDVTAADPTPAPTGASPTPPTTPATSPAPTPSLAQPGGRWQPGPALPSAVEAAAVTTFGDQVWVLGGHAPDALAVDTVHVFDLSTGSWARGPDLPAALRDVAAVSDGDVLWAIGGTTADDEAVRTTYRLEDPSGAWTAGPPLPAARGAGAAAWDGTRILYAGGLAGGQDQDSIWALQDGGWVDVGRLGTARNSLTAVSDGGGTTWFLNGELTVDEGRPTALGVAERLVGTQVESLPDLAVRRATAAFYLPGLGPCVVGGLTEPDTQFQSRVECPLRVAGTAEPPGLGVARAGLGATVLGSQVVTVGGFTPQRPGSDTVEVLPYVLR